MEKGKNKDSKETDSFDERPKRRLTKAEVDAITPNPTNVVRSRKHRDTLAGTGTNISYEGATAPGGGGSVGTGNSSGQNATGSKISSDNANDHIKTEKKKKKNENK